MDNAIKILVVDDEERIRRLLKMYLEREEYVIDEAEDGDEALHKAITNDYDLILLDEDMKPLDGITVMKKLKSIRSFNTKVLLLTRNNDYEYNDDYLKYGFSDYILKPLEKEKFLEKIDKCLK